MNPILARFQDQPALVEESRSAWLESHLAAVAQRLEAIEEAAAESGGEDFWGEGWGWLRPYVVKNGILHVPVKGVLLNDFPYALGGWATGYEYIWQAIKRGVDDSDVKGIALVINSGGGMVSGNFDLVDRIYEARSTKPIHAFAAEHAYSAAYNIASAANHLTVARTGGVGSIGVVVTHFEYSRAFDEMGVTVNIIRSKPDKMEGNPYEALSEGARERIQEVVDEFHQQFATMVARNRGMSFEAVDATDAHTFMAQQAIDNGLADAIGSLDDAITAFEATFSEGDTQMATNTQAENPNTITEQALANAVASAKAEGFKEGASAERGRISAILALDESKVRPSAALALALDTDLSAEQATAFLGKLPEENKQEAAGAGVPRGMFQAAMDKNNPNVSAEGDDENDAKGDAAVVDSIFASVGKTRQSAA